MADAPTQPTELGGLIDPAAHEPPAGAAWSASAARDTITAIVADVEWAYDEANLWPGHPRDGATAAEASGAEPGLTSLYYGGAGVIWALEHLRLRESVTLTRDYEAVAARLPERHAAAPDFPRPDPEPGPGSGADPERAVGQAPSLWMGECGVRLVAQLLSPSLPNADALHAAIQANVDNPALELMWGPTGTMLAAAAMHERTDEPRWRAAWERSAGALWAAWTDELWGQRLYGRAFHGLGPAHGGAGTIAVLSRGDLLDPARRAELESRAVAAYTRLAIRRDGNDRDDCEDCEDCEDREDCEDCEDREAPALAQWPASIESDTPRTGGIRLQWCHGSPGVVASLSHLAPEDDAFTGLLLAGGELTWRAGPLRKGPGLCHGTAGSGYALLKLLARTGDEVWLDRARAFAMHAIGQIEAARECLHRGHYTLWTGDLGAAVYLQDCIDAHAVVPTLDRF